MHVPADTAYFFGRRLLSLPGRAESDNIFCKFCNTTAEEQHFGASLLVGPSFALLRTT